MNSTATCSRIETPVQPHRNGARADDELIGELQLDDITLERLKNAAAARYLTLEQLCRVAVKWALDDSRLSTWFPIPGTVPTSTHASEEALKKDAIWDQACDLERAISDLQIATEAADMAAMSADEDAGTDYSAAANWSIGKVKEECKSVAEMSVALRVALAALASKDSRIAPPSNAACSSAAHAVSEPPRNAQPGWDGKRRLDALLAPECGHDYRGQSSRDGIYLAAPGIVGEVRISEQLALHSLAETLATFGRVLFHAAVSEYYGSLKQQVADALLISESVLHRTNEPWVVEAVEECYPNLTDIQLFHRWINAGQDIREFEQILCERDQKQARRDAAKAS